jgi:hypothetical protein
MLGSMLWAAAKGGPEGGIVFEAGETVWRRARASGGHPLRRICTATSRIRHEPLRVGHRPSDDGAESLGHPQPQWATINGIVDSPCSAQHSLEQAQDGGWRRCSEPVGAYVRCICCSRLLSWVNRCMCRRLLSASSVTVLMNTFCRPFFPMIRMWPSGRRHSDTSRVTDVPRLLTLISITLCRKLLKEPLELVSLYSIPR